MSAIPFSYDDYLSTRNKLVEFIWKRLTDKDRNLILRFETGVPDWNLFPYSKVKNLPAIKWKLQNILKLKEMNPKKHDVKIEKLKSVLKL